MTIRLYTHPGTCGRVTAIALEECGVDYAMEPVRLAKGEHRGADYARLNALGKVPALAVDGRVLTETVAILGWLNDVYPHARLLPATSDAFEAAQQRADLCFCAATLHPIVTRIAIPSMFGPPEALDAIRAAADAMMRRFLAIVEARMLAHGAWYPTGWSIMDGYLSWIWWRITGAGFDGAAFAALAEVMAQTAARPSVQRALAREADVAAQLASEGATVDLKSITPATAA